MTRTATWWFVSDLHLDLPETQQRDTSVAFAEFLSEVVRADISGSRHLVLLGDTFELLDVADGLANHEALAVGRLDALANRHAPVFDGLSACVRDGITIEVVCGNHDAHLTRPAVGARLAQLLNEQYSHRHLRVRPWVLYEPGLFYAEHGSQHHELNRLPTILASGLSDPASDLPLPPLATLHRRPARVAELAGAILAARRAESAVTSVPYGRLVDDAAAELGLPKETMRALASLSRFRPLPSVARACWRLLQRGLLLSDPNGYLMAAAERVHYLLARSGRSVDYYIFGHTHRAAITALAPADASYVNTGTWSSVIRGRGPDTQDNELFPYVIVSVSELGRQGSLTYWRRSSRSGGSITDPHVTCALKNQES